MPAHAPFNAKPMELQEESDNLVFFFKCRVISKCKESISQFYMNEQFSDFLFTL